MKKCNNMPKPRDIPFSRMHTISDTGVFAKRFSWFGKTEMKPYAHRDDYFIFVFLTEGTATVEIDFERRELYAGDMLIISPWQVHNKPSGEVWRADGWMLAFSPEFLSDQEARLIEEYSISPRPFRMDENIGNDVCALCSMLKRYAESSVISGSIVSTVKSIVLSELKTTGDDVSGRFKTITLRLRKLLDVHLKDEKRPSSYASMLNISEVYLNEAVKETTGLSVGAYIRKLMIVRAKRLLAYTSQSTKEIAFSLGYDDYAYFSKVFKKSEGMSPSEYRKNLK